MNNSEIKAELRRSACEDENLYQVSWRAYVYVEKFFTKGRNGFIPSFKFYGEDWRIFFLLVAEAI